MWSCMSELRSCNYGWSIIFEMKTVIIIDTHIFSPPYPHSRTAQSHQSIYSLVKSSLYFLSQCRCRQIPIVMYMQLKSSGRKVHVAHLEWDECVRFVQITNSNSDASVNSTNQAITCTHRRLCVFSGAVWLLWFCRSSKHFSALSLEESAWTQTFIRQVTGSLRSFISVGWVFTCSACVSLCRRMGRF